MLVFNHMPSPLPSHAAYLLAGGRSSRMGENKALLNFRGLTLLDRALATLSATCASVTIVGDPVIFANYGPVLPDIFPGCGPLAGIHAALTHSSAELNVMLAVDTPFVSVELLRFVLRKAGDTRTIVTVPQTARGLQPLCAVYRRAFASIAEEAIRSGRYKVDEAFADVPIHMIDERELAAAGFS